MMKTKKKVTPFECYKTYIAMKQHFTKEKYDYVKYAGKSRASIVAFNKRKDRYFFERMSRKKTDDEITQYFISNFISSDDPSKVWIGEIIHSGENTFKEWQKRNPSVHQTLFFKKGFKFFNMIVLIFNFHLRKSHST